MSPRAAQAVFGAGALLLFLTGLAVGFFGPENLFDWAEASPALWLVGSALLTAVSFAIGSAWMNGIDELAQRAHYVAWYWGGSTAIAVLMFLFLAAPALGQSIDFAGLVEALSPVRGEAAGFTAGVVASMLTMLLGYGVWWLIFWLRKQ